MRPVPSTAGVETRAREGAIVWLRPFDELAVGDSYTSGGRTVTEADIVRFAALTGEMSPVSGNPGLYTGGTTAGQVGAPALLALTYSIGLVPNHRVAALRRVHDLRLLAPVGPGDTIRVRCEILRLVPWTEDHGLVTGGWTIVTQEEAVAMTVELEAVWQRTRR